MDETFTAIHDLFMEQHGRMADTADECIQWARTNDLIRDDEFGAFCLAGCAEGVGV